MINALAGAENLKVAGRTSSFALRDQNLDPNAYCGAASVTGSNPTVLGNAGLAPVDASAGGC